MPDFVYCCYGWTIFTPKPNCSIYTWIRSIIFCLFKALVSSTPPFFHILSVFHMFLEYSHLHTKKKCCYIFYLLKNVKSSWLQSSLANVLFLFPFMQKLLKRFFCMLKNLPKSFLCPLLLFFPEPTLTRFDIYTTSSKCLLARLWVIPTLPIPMAN